jgi:MFS family permease
VRRLLHPIGIVLSNPGLRRLQISWAGSIFGSCAYLIALSVVAFRAGGATTVGLVFLAKTAAAAITSPLVGGLADRHSRRWLMAASDGGRAVLTLGMALVVGAGAESHSQALDVYAFAVAIAVVGAVFRPAQASLTPELAASPEELTASNALSGTIESVGIFAGPGIGGLVMAVSGPHVVFALCCAAYALSAGYALSITEPAREPTAPAEGADGDSFSILASAPALVAVTVTYAAQAFVAGALSVLAVVLAIGELGLGPPGVGYLDSAFGVGGVIGGVIATAMSGTQRLAAAFALGVTAWGVGVALIGVSTTTVIVLLLMAGVGVGNTIVDVAAVTLIQRSAPDEVLGRVFGVIESVLMASLGAGSAVAPLFEHRLGLRGALIVIGLALPVVVVLAQRWLIRLDHVDPQVAQRVGLLRAHRIFAPLAEATLEQLARQLDPLEPAAGNWVIRQGEVGDHVYVVESGRLAVDVDGRAGEELAAGDVFGEIALLRDIPRTASVRTLTDCRLLALGRDEFLAAITGHPRSAAEAAVVVSARLAALRPGLVTT